MSVSRIRWLHKLIPPLLAATLLSAVGRTEFARHLPASATSTDRHHRVHGDATHLPNFLQKAPRLRLARLGHVATTTQPPFTLRRH